MKIAQIPIHISSTQGFFVVLFLLIVMVTACSTTNKIPAVDEQDFHSSEVAKRQIIAGIPDYRTDLTAIKGKAKAIVSGPKKTHRVTLYFSGNWQRSLIDVKSSIGVEGATILAFGDSLLIYNKVKNYARKISVQHSDLQGIDHLATLNLLKLINPTIENGKVDRVSENESGYLLSLQNGGGVLVNKGKNLIRQITQPPGGGMPYSKIVYQGYDQTKGLTLPRRITIFSADRSTRIDLLVKSLEINPPLKKVTIHLPDDIKIYHR